MSRFVASCLAILAALVIVMIAAALWPYICAVLVLAGAVWTIITAITHGLME